MLALALAVLATAAEPTLAVVNARVWTGNPKQPWAEALAVSGNRILALGSTSQIRELAGASTRVVDALGATVTPGFIDSHAHPIIRKVPHPPVFLRTTTSRQEFVERIQRYAGNVPKGTWLLSSDWDETTWGGEMPSREWIDRFTPDHPVWLTRSDLTLGVANSAALRAAGIAGSPTGVVKGAAMMQLDRAACATSATEDDRTLDQTMRYYAEQGITSVRDATSGWDQFIVWERARRDGRLKVRVFCAAPLPAWQRLAEYIAEHGRGDAWFHWGLLKGFHQSSADPLDSFPQSGPLKPPSRPLNLQKGENYYAWISGASRAGLQIAVHGTTRGMVDIFERVAREQQLKDPRFTAEHAHEYLPGDIGRYARLGIVASMQPGFAYEPTMVKIRKNDPARWAGLFPYGALADAGVVLALGTDANTTPEAPLTIIGVAMTHPVQPGGRALRLDEALRAYTWAGAYASFEENEKGTLEPGKLADFVVLEADLTRISPEQFRNVRVRMTVVDGKPTYEWAADKRE